MCLIIAKQPGSIIETDSIEWGCLLNDDGFGFMYVDEDGLQIEKGYQNYVEFIEAFRKLEEQYPDSPFVLHMRMSTSGNEDYENCHPFKIHDDVGMVHNGIINDYSLKDNAYSDSFLFNKYILQTLPEGFIYNRGINLLLEDYAKDNASKFVLLDSNKTVKIYNESAGAWDNGVWISSPTWCKNFNTSPNEINKGFEGTGSTLIFEDEMRPYNAEHQQPDYMNENAIVRHVPLCDICNSSGTCKHGTYNLCDKCWTSVRTEHLVCEYCGVITLIDFDNLKCHECGTPQDVDYLINYACK